MTVATLTARLMPVADGEAFAAAAGLLVRVSREGEATLARARTDAATIATEAERAAEAFRDATRVIADDQLVEYVNQATVERTAHAFAQMLRAVEGIRADFDAMASWLPGLVSQAMRRIVGSYDDTALTEAAVAHAMDETRGRWALAIRVHPDRAADLRALISSHPDRLSPVGEVQVDAVMDPETCLLVGTGGLIDLTILTQIDGLAAQLAAGLAADRAVSP